MVKLVSNKLTDKDSNVFLRSLVTGLIAGLFWGSLFVFLYYFNFSEVAPASFLLRSWLSSGWIDGWLGDLVSIFLAGIVSVFVAILYYILLRKKLNMWVGVLYGAFLWGILFYLFQPLYSNIPSLNEMSKETIVSTFCLFLLYGTFIGYSISYDYFDSKLK
ncbi:YqhR family membrane protein [Virgibacillus sp. W0430]|uniref:YqhR family membrane protein n=1 Tax=Virgibacillus sp. W0430 TaxID=3391580 RepID=UPI003F48C842